MTVRPARAEDARGIAKVHVETWRATYPGVMPQKLLDELSVDEREARWRSMMGRGESATFVAEADGDVVGFVSVGRSWTEPQAGELYAIYVVPRAQGTGAGLALMETAVEWLSERFDEAILWVATENPPARRFYERYGWAPDGARVDDSFPGASVPETRYRLSGLGRR